MKIREADKSLVTMVDNMCDNLSTGQCPIPMQCPESSLCVEGLSWTPRTPKCNFSHWGESGSKKKVDRIFQILNLTRSRFSHRGYLVAISNASEWHDLQEYQLHIIKSVVLKLGNNRSRQKKMKSNPPFILGLVCRL